MTLNFELKDSKFRSWFCVLNNPEKVWEGAPKDIAQNALAAWLADKPSRTGAVAYCISAQGLHHLHMVLEDTNKARFSAIKKAFPSAHLEPTMGSKQQADDYINKRGDFAESGEQVICVVQHGEIQSNQGKRTDIAVIETLLDAGYTPNEILNLQFSFRRYDRMIKDAYFDRRYKQTAVVRDVKVYWHVGESGSGKSYTYKTLCDDIGDDKIYFVSDYDNGYLDKYNGEPVLFLDEFRGQICFGQLLSILGNYRVQLHSRYSNTYALWSEVHITSVLPPELVYRRMVAEDKAYDSIKQLYRRIDYIVLHWRYPDDTFSQMSVPMSDYKGYDKLRLRAGLEAFPSTWEYIDYNPFNK